MKQPEEQSKAWSRLTEQINNMKPSSTRLLVLAAHPDDESIGASSLLPKFDSWVAFLTDGAPRDSRLWSGGPYESRDQYASVRRREAEAALRCVGIAADRIRWLGGVDQQAAEFVPLLTARLTKVLLEVRPEILVTHPYEGGHPDHDTASLVAKLATRRLPPPAPEIIEMTSYHARDGRCITGEFLEAESDRHLTVAISGTQRKRKQQMLAAHASQRVVLASFPTDRELFRAAPCYDYSQPPHGGSLWYERLGWPMKGERWRQFAISALSERAHSQSCG